MSAYRVLVTMIFSVMFSVMFIVILGFVDYIVITPLVELILLPDDICYYHTNTPPLWVDLFYLDSIGHIEPPFRLHVVLVLLLSVFLGIFTAIKLNKLLLNRDRANETKIES